MMQGSVKLIRASLTTKSVMTALRAWRLMSNLTISNSGQVTRHWCCDFTCCLTKAVESDTHRKLSPVHDFVGSTELDASLQNANRLAELSRQTGFQTRSRLFLSANSSQLSLEKLVIAHNRRVNSYVDQDGRS